MQTHARNSSLGLLSTVGLGAALMYFLDPARGSGRRSRMRSRFSHAGHVAGDAADATSRDLRNRAQGLAASVRTGLTEDHAGDAVIRERVRTTLGRVVSHPSAITVTADQGRVTLSGPVLAREVDRLLAKVGGVRGVREVENRLEVHESADGVSSLQGGVPRADLPEFAQENWTPAMRLLTAAGGGALALYAARRRDTLGTLLGVAGLALAARGSTNMSARRLTGVGAGRRAVDVRKAITINAPVDRVFPFFSSWENWPHWMTHVREVRLSGTTAGEQRTHWVVDGPAGVPVSWDAITTQFVPNQVIAWKSVEGAPLGHAGLIRFTPTADGATTVDVQMSYNPPGGAIGHAVASFFGRNPKQQMDDDLARLKTTIETNRPPHDAAQPVKGSAGAQPEAARTGASPGQLGF